MLFHSCSFTAEARRSVHRDAHVEVAKAYYSVPPEFVGRRVWVRWDRGWPLLADGGIAIYARHGPPPGGTATAPQRCW